MAIVRNVLVRVGADVNGYQKNINKANSSLAGFSSKQKKALYAMKSGFSDFFGSVGTGAAGIAGPIGIAVAAVGVLTVAVKKAVDSMAELGKESISAAMGAIESDNLFEVSMGNMAGAARKWSEDLQKSLYLNAYEVRQNVGTFYNMTTSMGLAKNQAYQVSTGLTKLAYDMSSFYNATPEDMFDKLQSGLSGEVEPLRRLGVVVNETTTNLYAYKTGIAKVGTTLTEQQKILARYGVIMTQTKNAQGDLARTITSPANQLRAFNSVIQQIKINIGNGLMPIVKAVLPIFLGLANAINYVTRIFAEFMNVLFGVDTSQKTTSSSADQAATSQTGLGQAVAQAGKDAKKGVAGFDEVNQLNENISSSANDAADAISTMDIPSKDDSGIQVPKWITDLANTIKTAVKPAMDDLKKAFGDLWKEAKNLYNELAPDLLPTLKAIGAISLAMLIADIEALAFGIKTLSFSVSGMTKVYDILKQTSLASIDFAGLIMGNFAKLVTGKETPKTILDNIKFAVQTIAPDLLTNVGKAWNSLTSAIFGPFKTFITGKDNPIAIFDNIKFAAQTIAPDVLKKIGIAWNGLTSTIKNVFTALINAKTGIPSVLFSLLDGVTNKPGEFIKAIKTNWSLITDTIMNIFNGFKTGALNIWDSIVSKITSAVDSIKSAINDVIKAYNSIPLMPNLPTITQSKTSSSETGSTKAIPHLATGGITNGPTLAMIGDNFGGREVVSPLGDLIDIIAGAVGSAVLSAMQFVQPKQSNTGELSVVIDGTKLARILIPYIDKENNRIGKTILQGA